MVYIKVKELMQHGFSAGKIKSTNRYFNNNINNNIYLYGTNSTWHF